MHEAEGARTVAETIVKSKATHVKVRLGKMRGNEKRFLQLVKEFLSGTGFEGAKIKIEPAGVTAKCKCGFCGNVDVSEHVHFVRCPLCGTIADILSGNELDIEINAGQKKS